MMKKETPKDLAAARLRKLNAESALREEELKVMRRETISRFEVCEKLSSVFAVMKSTILAARLDEATRDKLLAELARAGELFGQ